MIKFMLTALLSHKNMGEYMSAHKIVCNEIIIINMGKLLWLNLLGENPQENS